MTNIVPCPLCGGRTGYRIQESGNFKWWNALCSDCGELVTECRADRNGDIPETHPNADTAWNEAGAYAEGLRKDRDEARAEVTRLRELCHHAHDRLLRGDSDGELLESLAESWKGKLE